MSEREVSVNRWLIAVAAVILQLCLGTVYGWSVFTKPLQALGQWSLTEVTTVFTVAIGCLGVAAALGGMVLDRKGPRFTATIGAFLFGAGTLLTGFAAERQSLGMIYITYGVIAGIGNGLCYITPIAVLVKWFPDKRGVITGIAVMGFGIGAFLTTVTVPVLLRTIGINVVFYLFGAVFLVLALLAARYMVNPPDSFAVSGKTSAKKTTAATGVTTGAAVATVDFWLFWLTLFINISAGIALISQAAPLIQEIFIQTPARAGIIIGVFSLFNGFGRLFWSWLSDGIGRRNVFVLIFVTQAVLFLALPYIHSLPLFMVMASYIYSCYGGGFSTMPAFVADTFGSRCIGSIYGYILTAWSAGAIAGPVLYSRMHDFCGYSAAFTITGIWLAVATVIPLGIGRSFLKRGAVKFDG